MLELSKNIKAALQAGIQVSVFKEAGKDVICLKDLMDNDNVVVADKHA